MLKRLQVTHNNSYTFYKFLRGDFLRSVYLDLSPHLNDSQINDSADTISKLSEDNPEWGLKIYKMIATRLTEEKQAALAEEVLSKMPLNPEGSDSDKENIKNYVSTIKSLKPEIIIKHLKKLKEFMVYLETDDSMLEWLDKRQKEFDRIKFDPHTNYDLLVKELDTDIIDLEAKALREDFNNIEPKARSLAAYLYGKNSSRMSKGELFRGAKALPPMFDDVSNKVQLSALKAYIDLRPLSDKANLRPAIKKAREIMLGENADQKSLLTLTYRDLVKEMSPEQIASEAKLYRMALNRSLKANDTTILDIYVCLTKKAGNEEANLGAHVLRRIIETSRESKIIFEAIIAYAQISENVTRPGELIKGLNAMERRMFKSDQSTQKDFDPIHIGIFYKNLLISLGKTIVRKKATYLRSQFDNAGLISQKIAIFVYPYLKEMLEKDELLAGKAAARKLLKSKNEKTRLSAINLFIGLEEKVSKEDQKMLTELLNELDKSSNLDVRRLAKHTRKYLIKKSTP